jgi:hypothetical protein
MTHEERSRAAKKGGPLEESPNGRHCPRAQLLAGAKRLTLATPSVGCALLHHSRRPAEGGHAGNE